MMPDSLSANISVEAYAPAVMDTAGVVWPFYWRDLEVASGVYDFARMDAALKFCVDTGRYFMPRLQYKSFQDASDPPQSPVVPDFVLVDPATYGGLAGSGGTLRGYHYSGTFIWHGWTALLTNTSVRARLIAMFSAIAGRYANQPLFVGFVIDEILLGIYNGSWPAGITQQSELNAIYDLVDAAISAFSGRQVFVLVNYFDGDPGPDYTTTVAAANSIIAKGAVVGLTDVFLSSGSAQPTYPVFSTQAKGMAFVDYGNFGSDDAGLQDRTNSLYQKTGELRAKATTWCCRGGWRSNFWQAARNAFASLP